MSLFIFIFNTFLFILHLYSTFLESTSDKLPALKGYIKIYTLKKEKIAVWKLEPSERRDCSVYVISFMSHAANVKKTPTVLMLFCALPQVAYASTKYKYEI